MRPSSSVQRSTFNVQRLTFNVSTCFLFLCLLSADADAMGRPQSRHVDQSTAIAQIGADTGVNVVKEAVAQPPVSVHASGTGNVVELTVTPNDSHTAVSGASASTGRSRTNDALDKSVRYTLGQKIGLLAIGLGIFFAVIAVVVWWFKRQFPAISLAIDGMVSVFDKFAATEIQKLRVKVAAAQSDKERAAYQDAIATLEAARGVAATERGKLEL